MCVCSYTLEVVDVDVVQPAQVLVSLQEAGQLLVLRDRLGEQLAPLPLLHVPAKQEVCKVLQQEMSVLTWARARWPPSASERRSF